jgi:CubicO group peptidase (beta-lactamase class C family)
MIVHAAYSQSSEENHNLTISYDQKRLERIDRVVNEAINNGEIPGAVVLVNQNDKDIFHKSYGFSDIVMQKKMELNSIFRIASMTKAITAVGVMILYERGHFLLNDPISKFIPEFKNPEIIVAVDSIGEVLEKRPAKREIRIIDLLTHTSGIAYPFLPTKLQQVYKKNNLIDAVTEQNILLKDEMIKLAQLPLLFEPGSQYQYGLGIDVLGYLCEVITEKSLDKFLKDEIFIPLKMVDTQFYLPVEKTDRLVKLYSWDSGKLVESKGDESAIKIDNVNFPFEGAKTYFSGGGG